MKITVDGKELDLSGALPLTLGDLKKLKRAYGFGDAQLASGDILAAAAVLLILLQKLDSSITEEQLDRLPLATVEGAFQFIAAEAKNIHRPT